MSAKKPTPPTGVAAIDDWETTGVTDSPKTDVKAGGSYDPAKATARKALAQMGELRGDFRRFESQITARFEEHATEDREQFRRIDEKLDGQNEVLAKLRETSAATSVELKQIGSSLRDQRRAASQAAERDADLKLVKEKVEVEDTAHAKKFKRDLVLKVIAVLGPVFAALGGAVALLVRSC